MIQHNIVFTTWWYLEESAALNIIAHRYRRMIFDEIKEMETIAPNYKGARILGFCLNVMGFAPQKKENANKNYYALHKTVLLWTKKNFLKIHRFNPEIAKACLMGRIRFDQKNNTLVKEFLPNLSGNIPQEILELI